MRNISPVLVGIVSCFVGQRMEAQVTPPTNPAGASAAPATRDSIVATDRWISRPTPIVLTPNQRAQYDSVRAEFVRAMDGIRAQNKSAGEMAIIMKVRGVTRQYQMYVRAILTPIQQPIFDANVKADVIGS